MLPEPTPAPIASASGRKMPSAAIKTGQQPDEHSANYRAGDVFGKHTAAFRGVHPIFFADDRKARLPADREGGADGFAPDAEQERDRQAEDHGAEEMTQLLKQERISRSKYLRQRGADKKA